MAQRSRGYRTWMAAAILALPGLAQAQERAEAQLSYTVAEGLVCPGERAFRDTVAGRLGYDPFRDEAARRIDARISSGPGGLVGRVEVVNAAGRRAGSRKLQAAEGECDELVSSLAIAVSILLDPFSAAGVTPPPKPAPPPPPPKPEAPPPPVECPEPPERASLPVHLLGGAELGGSIGLTPGVALGPSVMAGVWWNQWTFALQGRADVTPLPVETDRGDVSAAVYSVGPRACYQQGVGIACASAQAGIFQGRGVDLAVSRSDTGRFVSGDVALGLALPLGRTTWLSVLGELRAPPSRTSLEVDGQTAWTAPPLALGLRIGIFAAFSRSDDGNGGD